MKHPEVDHQAVERVLGWVDSSLDSRRWDQLGLLAGWLKDEAIKAGGLGPNEATRIWTRHLADSLAFAYAWRDLTPPARLLDVGAGIGLPGIPLAVLWPETAVTLLDRSGKRIDLATRAVRRLRLENVEVRQGDVFEESAGWEGATFRAVFSPERALEVANSVLAPDGLAVVGLRGSGVDALTSSKSPGGRPVQAVELPPTVLDGPVSLLIMGSSDY